MMSQTQTPRYVIRWSPALAATTQHFTLLADSSLMFSFLCSTSRRQQFLLRKRKADRLSRPAAVEGGTGPEADGQGVVRCLGTHSGNNPPATFLPEHPQQDTGIQERCGRILLWRKPVVTGEITPQHGLGASLRKAGLPVE